MATPRELLQIPSTLSNYKSMSNGVVRITFDTQENIQPELKAKILAGHEQFGWLSFLIGDKKIAPEDIVELPPLPKKDKEQKSPGEMLYNRMFVYYMSCHKDKSKFNQWREEQLLKLGEKYLNKIDK